MSENIASGLTAVGDAIREKTNTTSKLKIADMPEAIRSIKSGAEKVKINDFKYLFTQSHITKSEADAMLSILDVPIGADLSYMFNNASITTLLDAPDLGDIQPSSLYAFCNLCKGIGRPSGFIKFKFKTTWACDVTSLFGNNPNIKALDLDGSECKRVMFTNPYFINTAPLKFIWLPKELKGFPDKKGLVYGVAAVPTIYTDAASVDELKSGYTEVDPQWLCINDGSGASASFYAKIVYNSTHDDFIQALDDAGIAH